MHQIAVAADHDVPALVRLINTSYEVEKFFVSGDRTNADQVRQMMQSGEFLVARDAADAIAGCVYVKFTDERGYFGLLSVDPSRQRGGLGSRLVRAAESHARTAGCTAMDLRVVNLRAELPPFYRRLGYGEAGVEQANEPRALQPFHFLRMSKRL